MNDRYEETIEEVLTPKGLRSRLVPRWVEEFLAKAELSGNMVRYRYRETPVGRFPMDIEIATPADELRSKVKEIENDPAKRRPGQGRRFHSQSHRPYPGRRRDQPSSIGRANQATLGTGGASNPVQAGEATVPGLLIGF